MNIGNCSHRPAPYVEWFYFHFACTDGMALNMVLHETGIFGLKTQPYLSLSIHWPQQTLYRKRAIPSGAIAANTPYLHVGQQLFSEDEQRIIFDIPFDENTHFRGEIYKLAPPLVIEGGKLYHRTNDSRCSYWVVGVPHATFEAVLTLNGQKHVLTGFAYQDHQWGDILFQEWVSDWVWGHFSNAETAVLFFQILTQEGERIERVARQTAEGWITNTCLETNYVAQLQAHAQPEHYAATVTVPIFQEQIAFDVYPANLMRHRLNEPVEQHCASYLRWAATAHLLACGPSSLYGITEYIRLRPVHERVLG